MSRQFTHEQLRTGLHSLQLMGLLAGQTVEQAITGPSAALLRMHASLAARGIRVPAAVATHQRPVVQAPEAPHPAYLQPPKPLHRLAGRDNKRAAAGDTD